MLVSFFSISASLSSPRVRENGHGRQATTCSKCNLSISLPLTIFPLTLILSLSSTLSLYLFLHLCDFLFFDVFSGMNWDKSETVCRKTLLIRNPLRIAAQTLVAKCQLFIWSYMNLILQRIGFCAWNFSSWFIAFFLVCVWAVHIIWIIQPQLTPLSSLCLDIPDFELQQSWMLSWTVS